MPLVWLHLDGRDNKMSARQAFYVLLIVFWVGFLLLFLYGFLTSAVDLLVFLSSVGATICGIAVSLTMLNKISKSNAD